MKEMNKKFIAFMLVVIIVTSIFSLLIIQLSSNVDEVKDTVQEELQKPIFCKIMPSTRMGTAPCIISFDTLLQNNESLVFINWNFGDGSTSSEINPLHEYQKAGQYICSLQIKDSTNHTANDEVKMEIGKNKPPDVKILVNKQSKYKFEKFELDADVIDEDSENFTYKWEIVSPTKFIFTNTIIRYEKNFSIQFLVLGDFEVTLTVTDDAGNVVTENIRLKNKFSKPRIAISDAINSYATGGAIIGFLMTFGFWRLLLKIFENRGMERLVDVMNWLVHLFNVPTDDNPIISNPKPADGVYNVPVEPTLSVKIDDPQDQLMHIYFETNISDPHIWESLPNGIHFGKDGLYACNTTGVFTESNTTYYWRVQAIDSEFSGQTQYYHFSTQHKDEIGMLEAVHSDGTIIDEVVKK